MTEKKSERLESLIDQAATDSIERLLASLSGAEIARVISQLPLEKQNQLLEALQPAEAADVVERLSDVQAAQIVGRLEPDTAAAIVHELPSNGKQQVGDPVSGAYFDLIDNANTMVITSSLATKNLLTLIVDGKDSEQAEELASGLDGIEQNEMYDKMDVKKGPKEEPNSTFAESMPAIFGQGGKLSNVSWIKSKVDTLGAITDGSANTIMLLENPHGRPWLEDNPLTVDEAIELVSGLEDGAANHKVAVPGSGMAEFNSNLVR